MKKILWSLGLIGIVSSPIVLVASSGKKIESNYEINSNLKNFTKASNDVNSLELPKIFQKKTHRSWTNKVTDIHKFDFDKYSSKTPAQLNQFLTRNSVTPAELGFPEPILSDGTTATFKIIDFEIPFVYGTFKQIHVFLRHDSSGYGTSFKLWPKYDFNQVKIPKIMYSSKIGSQLNYDIANSEHPTRPTAEELGINLDKINFPYSDIKIEFSFMNDIVPQFIDGKVIKMFVRLIDILNPTSDVYIPISFISGSGFDFHNDILEFVDAISNKNIKELSTITSTTNLTAGDLGLPEPMLSYDTTATYSIPDNVFHEGVSKIATATLIHGEWKITITFRLFAGYDFSSDIAKFSETIISTKTKNELYYSVYRFDTNPTAEQLGLTYLKFSHLTTADFLVKSGSDFPFFDDKEPSVIIVRFKHNGQYKAIAFNFLAKHDFSDAVSKFKDVVSIKTIKQLRSTITTTTPTAEQLGFREPILFDGTIVTYSIDNTAFTNSLAKVITANLNYYGQFYTVKFNLTPAFDFSNDIVQFKDMVSSKTATELNTDIKSNTPTAAELGIITPILSDGTTASYSINSTKFNDTNAMTVIVHLNHNGETLTTTFNLTSGFSFSSDIAKFTDVISTKFTSQLNADVHTNNPTAEQLGIPTPKLSDDTTVTYSIDSHIFSDTDTKIITAYLNHNNKTTTTIFFNLTPAFSFVDDIAKFTDVTSSKIAEQLNADVHTSNPTAEQLGISTLKLSDDTTVTYSIDSHIFSDTDTKTITAYLKNINGQSATTTFSLKSAHDFSFSSDIARFVDVTSTKIAAQLNNDVTSLNPTAEQLGIATPKLSIGTSVNYFITPVIFLNKVSIVVTVYLNYNGVSKTTTFNLTPAFDFSDDKERFNDLISTKTVAELRHDLKTIHPTAEQLGITYLKLSDGTTVTYSMYTVLFTRANTLLVTAHLNHNGKTVVRLFNLRPATLY